MTATISTGGAVMARLLARSAGEESSGILTATRARLVRLFCIDSGSVVWAVSNIIEEQLQETLVGRGVIDRAGLEQAVKLAAEADQPLTGWLVSSGAIERGAMEQAVTAHVRGLLTGTLAWNSGDISFRQGTPDLAGEITVRLWAPAVVLGWCRSDGVPDDQLPSQIRSDLSRWRLAAPVGDLHQGLAADRDAGSLIQVSRSPATASVMVSAAEVDPQAGLRTLWGLILCGVIEPATTRAAATDGPITRAEMVARIERAEDADHYGVLEVGSTAPADDIRSAYYFLARRYHPDRFRTGPLTDMIAGVEDYFTKVTEAYNTLCDDDLRASYDEVRAQSIQPDAEQDTAFLARENFARARVAIERGRLTDAVKWIENAIKLDGSKAEYPLELGRVLSNNPRRRKDAERYLLEAGRLDPALVDTYVALGDLYQRMNRLEDAERRYREALQWEPGHIEATERLATVGGGRSRH